MKDRTIQAGFGRHVIARDRIWLHLRSERSEIEDAIDLSVSEAEAVIARLQGLVDQHKARSAPEAKA
jgi:hypothetical protein